MRVHGKYNPVQELNSEMQAGFAYFIFKIQWKLKLANIWERGSDPSPGIINDDFQWLLSLGYAF